MPARAKASPSLGPEARVQTSAQAIAELLRGYRFNHDNEKELQAGIEQILSKAGLRFERECRLGEAGQIDFLVGGVGVEVKIKGSLTAMTIQVHRYTRRDEVTSLLVATTKKRLLNLPSEMNGKPIVTVWLGGAF